MQSLNDDMDELFRRAGEDYPLNTDGADWDKVMQKMQHTGDDLQEEINKRNNYKFLWLLLLLPIGFICGRYVGNNKGGVYTNGTPVNAKSLTADKTMPVEVLPGAITAGQKSTKPTTADKKERVTDQDAAGNNVGETGNNSLFTETKISHNIPVVSGNFKTGNSSKKTANDGINLSFKNDHDMGNLGQQPEVATPVNEGKVGQSTPLKTTVQKAGEEKVITADHIADTVKPSVVGMAKPSAKKTELFKKHLYYSFVVGPDVSFVKSQHTSKLGYTAGLMIGYQFSRKLSIEAGVLWSRKNYYSAGNYLDTSGLKLPMHSMVNKVDGYCDMIDVPVNVRYNFLAAKKHNWFAAAGLSSYFMKNEEYNIAYDRYGVAYTKEYGYNNSSKDWFAIINLSAGYNIVSGKTNLTFAPYIKLPARGVGIGKLPIASTGFYLVLSRPMH